MLRWTIAAFCVFGGVACATTPTGLTPPSRDLVVEAEGLLRTYDNGLTLFIAPDPHTELLQLDMRQRVGTRDDPPGKGAVAHLVEHLMFSIVDPTTSTTIASQLSNDALYFNALTSADETDYTQTGTREDLAMFLRHAALRLGADCRALGGPILEREREIVRNETAWRRSLVMPLLRHDVLSHAFPPEHPYHRAPFPDDAELDAITVDDICAFVDRYYTASQTTIVITGDVDPIEVATLAESTIAPLPNITVEPRSPMPRIALGGRTVEIAADIERPTTLVLFELPPRFTREHVGSRIASHLLLLFGYIGQIRGGVDKETMATILPVELGGKEATLVGIMIETPRAADLQRATELALDNIFEGFATSGGGTAFKVLYDVARQVRRLDIVDSIFRMDRRGTAYADYLEQPGGYSFVGGELSTIDGLSGDDLQDIARATFARERMLVVEVVPRERAQSSRITRARFDVREIADAIPPTIVAVADDPHRPIEIPHIAPDTRNIRAIHLDNGMRVVLARSTRMPIVEMEIVLEAGFDDAEEAPVLATLAAATYRPRNDEIAEDALLPFKRVGSVVEHEVDRRTTTFRTRGLAIYLDHLVAGLAEHVVEAELDPLEYKRWHKREAVLAADPVAADERARTRAVFEALYGEGHPWARVEDAKGASITPELVRAFRRANYVGERATLLVSGGIDLDLATEHVRAHFGSGKRKLADVAWNSGRERARIDVPAPQRDVAWLFTEVDDRRIQTDVTVWFALDDIFGRGHASLAVAVEMLAAEVARVREVLGISYGIHASIRFDPPRVEVHGAIDGARASEGIAALQAALASVVSGPDFDRRFALARRRVVQGLLAAQGDPRRHAEQFVAAARHDVGFDMFDHLPRRVAATTPASVRAQLERVLPADGGVMLVQGPQAGVDAAYARRGKRRHVPLQRPDRHAPR